MQVIKGKISLYSIPILKDDGSIKKENAALICFINKKPIYMDLNSFRPDPRDILERKKSYKVKFFLYNEVQPYLESPQTLSVVKKIISIDNTDFTFVNIR
jgi:hypothetical protein